jgi:acetyltransferase-like isoleucine patch superfamily enzyme
MKRKLQRVLFYSLKFFIGLLVYMDSRIYMKYYNWLLKNNGVKVNGTPRFIAKSVKFDDFDRIVLGDRLVVSMNVHFLTHDYSFTTALIAINETPKKDIGLLRDIFIGTNVFIGMNCILLPGSNIGNNVIIGAGSIVRGTIPDFAIVAGNPAQVIGDIREYAQKVKSRKNQDLRKDTK